MIKIKKKARRNLVRWIAVILCLLMFLPILSYFIPSGQSESDETTVYAPQEVDTEISTEEKTSLDSLDGPYDVSKLVAGDCIQIEAQVNEFIDVSLLGIETEEITEANDAGMEAYKHIESLIQGKRVYLKHIYEITERSKIETLVYLEDGTQLNEQMLRDGFARVSSSLPAEVKNQFHTAMQDAKENNKGLWEDCWNEEK